MTSTHTNTNPRGLLQKAVRFVTETPVSVAMSAASVLRKKTPRPPIESKVSTSDVYCGPENDGTVKGITEQGSDAPPGGFFSRPLPPKQFRKAG